jgi:sensor domain CHASE-containing protein
MEKEFGVVATPVLHLMKKSIKRTYILLVLFIVLFVVSIMDSIYQRCRIINILQELETVEKVIETECNEDVET